MESCKLLYIPERLHSDDKPELPTFEIGEILFRRCKHEEVSEPFDGIRLYDLSVNREGSKHSPLSYNYEVLYNIDHSKPEVEKIDEAVISLKILELANSRTYEKSISHPGLDGKNNPILNTCSIKLLHDRLPCNYSHCIFQLTFNGEIVTKDNWEKTLKKKSQHITALRTKCKLEFERMIIQREIRIEWGDGG